MVASPGIPGWSIGIGILIGLIGIGSAVARAMYRQSRGVNPFFAKEQVEAAIVNSEMMRPREAEPPHKPIEERLAELDDLHSRGVISEEEHRAARAKVLAEG